MIFFWKVSIYLGLVKNIQEFNRFTPKYSG